MGFLVLRDFVEFPAMLVKKGSEYLQDKQEPTEYLGQKEQLE